MNCDLLGYSHSAGEGRPLFQHDLRVLTSLGRSYLHSQSLVLFGGGGQGPGFLRVGPELTTTLI